MCRISLRSRLWGIVALSVLGLCLLGWKWILKAPWPVIGLWGALMGIYALLFFLHVVSFLAPAQGREREDLDRAFLDFLLGKLRSLGAVDAGQPRQSPAQTIGPGLWLLDARSAIAIERKGKLIRIAGPGLVRLEEDEQIIAFIDLRPQQFPRGSSPPVYQLRTQDGIALGFEIRTLSAFLPQSLPPSFHHRSPYFFPPKALSAAIIQALRAARVDEDQVLQWFELPHAMAREELSVRIGNRLFDRILLSIEEDLNEGERPLDTEEETHQPKAGHDEEGKPKASPRKSSLSLVRLTDELRSYLEERLTAVGIRVTRLSLAVREVPEEALRQRVEFWRSQWALRLARWIGLAESEVIMEYAQARHASQMEMLEAINQVLRAYPDVSPEVILLHFLETLDATVRRSGLTLPEELEELWKYLRGKESSST